MKNLLFSAVLLVGMPVSAYSQSLDTTFGTNGTVTHQGLGSYFDVTPLSDGSMILSGDYDDGTVSKAVLAKVNSAGYLDTSFAMSGTYTINQYSDYNYYETFSKALVQADGKLVVLYGAEYDNGVDPESITVKMIRLNADGSVDNSFSGYSAQNIAEDDSPYGIVILPSGKILMYGANYLMRFNTNGTLDTAYANNGKRTLSVDLEDLFVIGSAIYLYDYNGKKLVRLDDESSSNTKTYYVPQNSNYYVNGSNIYIYLSGNVNESITKLDSNFNPVNSFGAGGTATFSQTIGYGLTFQPQGSIIAETINYIYDTNNNPVSVDKEYRRVNPTGSLDSTFGNGGVYKINIPQSAPYNNWSNDYLHSNGKLYHFFYSKYGTDNNIYVKRSNLPNEILAADDAIMDANIRLVQNPVREILQISGNLVDAKIFDLSGKETGITFDGSKTPVDQLKPGVYIITATTESGQKIHLKFIKK